jgi:hypothetical protein
MMLTLRIIQFCHANNKHVRRLVQCWLNLQTSLVLLISNRHRMITYTDLYAPIRIGRKSGRTGL